MATNNALNVGLIGSTGTGAFVGANTPTLITPVLGVGAATSLNFGTSTTNGIIGITSGALGAAGVVGQVISSAVPFNTASLTTGTGANVTSISLTAGDWDVSGIITFAAGGTTVITLLAGGITNVSATLPSILSPTIDKPSTFASATLPVGASSSLPIAMGVINVSSTTTIYLVASANFTVDTLTAGGYILARRRR